jgi:hypothetical protein
VARWPPSFDGSRERRADSVEYLPQLLHDLQAQFLLRKGSIEPDDFQGGPFLFVESRLQLQLIQSVLLGLAPKRLVRLDGKQECSKGSWR